MALLKTQLATMIAMAGAFLLLSAGWLITGRIWKRTSCGSNPDKQQEGRCPPKGCGLCRSSDTPSDR